MRIKRRFLSVFLSVLLLAILLLASPYIVLADEIPPDFADGELVVAEEINEDTDDIPEDVNPPEINGGDVPENEDVPETGGIVPEDENALETGDEDVVAEQGDEAVGAVGIMPMNAIPPDSVDSEEAFWDWIDSHSDSGNVIGGSITLLANITIKKHISLSGSLHIETGSYGLTMNGGSIANGPFSITGEGVAVPVLTVVNMNHNPWDGVLSTYDVTARGRGGKGGVALRVSTSKDGSQGFIESQGLIRSEGENAVGVMFDNPVKAHYLSVSVEGKNSVAVSASKGASLYYSRLEASGNGSKIVSGGNILLDTCRLSGNASGADVINRKIISLAGGWLYWPLAQGQAIRNSGLYRTFYFNTVPLYFLLSGDKAHPAEVRSLPIEWDRDAMDDVDTSVIGKTVISGGLYSFYQGLGLEDDFSLDLTFDVREGGKPCIVSLKFGKDVGTGRSYAYFQTNDLDDDWFELKDGNFILWRSDDEGESWYDFTDSQDISHTSDSITYYYDEITAPVWFRVQEVGGEYSEIAVIYGYEGLTFSLVGGDRTGVDREGEDSTPSSSPSLKSRSKSSRSSRSSRSLPDSTSDAAVQTSAEIFSPLPADVPLLEEDTSAPAETRDNVIPNEWENDTATAISGKRLRMMMEAGNRVTFIKKEIRLSFDAAALERLNIGDGQLFTVAVGRLEELKYTVTATLDGAELYNLPCVATLDGNSHDILVSGTYDFTPPTDEPDVITAQTHSPELAVTQPSHEQAGAEETNSLADSEEEPAAWPTVIIVLLGTGGAVGVTVFVKLRVKKYGR